jgi:peptidoglycan/LPS O-acetylase OafA/YrhL
VWFGRFSYSSYLTHAPVLAVVWEFLVAPRGLAPVPAFAVLLVVGVPVSYVLAYTFYLLVERPFLTIRSLPALVAALPRLSSRRRAAPILTLETDVPPT